MKRTPLKKSSKKHSSSWYRKKCVEIAKKIALERDNYTCQKCDKNKYEDNVAIHGSHVFPEGRYHGMSANPDNIKALCYTCHFQWWHKNPIDASEWFALKFPERYAILKKLSREIIQKDWRAEFEIMKNL